MITEIKNLDCIFIFTKNEYKYDFSQDSCGKKYSISLYEYNDYWKVSWFYKGDRNVYFKIFPKTIVEHISYGVKT